MQLANQQSLAMRDISNWLKTPKSSRKPFFYLAGYAGSGKEQPITQKIQTPKGEIAIGDLNIGDELFGADGNVHCVNGVFPQGKKPVYEVTFRDGAKTRCGLDHLWKVGLSSKGWQVKSLREILEFGSPRRESGTFRYKIPLCEPVKFSNKDFEFSPYIIGALIGDGCLAHGTPNISIPPEKEFIRERIETEIGDNFLMTKNTAPSCPYYSINDSTHCHINGLLNYLRSVDLCVNSKERFIPREYLLGSIQQRKDLLAGLMDTDGSTRKGRTSFSTSSKKLANDMKYLVQSLGGTAIIHPHYRDDEIQMNIKTFFNPFSGGQKLKKWKFANGNPPSRYIVDIQKVGFEEQVCISVSASDNLYLTDEFVVTHNTTIAKVLKEMQERVVYAAFTGKAALVLASKGCYGASTIHSLIYKVKDKNSANPKLIWDPDSAASVADIIVVDEVSMVDEDLAKDLLKYGVPILVLGDPAQLPPVKGTGYFTAGKPDFMLTEIHRQAADNPIIRMSMDIREGRGLDFGQYGDSKVISRASLTKDPSMVTSADQVLVGLNKTRRVFNSRIRQLKGFDGFFKVDDRVVCLKNNGKSGLLNGGIWNVLRIVDQDKYETTMIVNPLDAGMAMKPVEVTTHHSWLDGTQSKLPWYKAKQFDPFDFGWCLSVHKSQGSQWDNVMVFDESQSFREDHAKWLYTAITRAAVNVTVVR